MKNSRVARYYREFRRKFIFNKTYPEVHNVGEIVKMPL
jgi:hypothetical protein